MLSLLLAGAGTTDGPSIFAMLFFALIIFLIFYMVSRRHKKENLKKNPFSNKLYSIYSSEEGFVLINHSSSDEKMIFNTIEELTAYININS